jgi:hypothetical protein
MGSIPGDPSLGQPDGRIGCALAPRKSPGRPAGSLVIGSIPCQYSEGKRSVVEERFHSVIAHTFMPVFSV